MRIKSIFAGIALACLSVSSAFAAGNAGPWVETTTPVLASATYTGTSHYLIAAGSGTGGASFFGGQFYADQDGTAYIDSSNDGTTWTVASTKALTATHTVDLNVPLRASYYRVRFVNGGTNQGAFRVFAAQTQSGAAGQTTDGAGAAGGGGAGDASAANQTAVQAVAGSDASKATAVQGITGGKAVPVSEADGSNATLGAKADSACATDNGSCSLTALVKRTNQNVTTLNTTASSALPAGSAIVGKFGIDQTTPGTTNGTQDAASSATGSAAPAKAMYAGANSSGNLTGIIQADASVKIDMSTATTTQLVALSSSKKIYITAWDVIAAGTGNIKLVYGTGSNCGTGTTDLTGNYNLTAQAGISKGSGLGPVVVVPASQALCATTSAAVQMSGSVAYTQF